MMGIFLSSAKRLSHPLLINAEMLKRSYEIHYFLTWPNQEIWDIPGGTGDLLQKTLYIMATSLLFGKSNQTQAGK